MGDVGWSFCFGVYWIPILTASSESIGFLVVPHRLIACFSSNLISYSTFRDDVWLHRTGRFISSLSDPARIRSLLRFSIHRNNASASSDRAMVSSSLETTHGSQLRAEFAFYSRWLVCPLELHHSAVFSRRIIPPRGASRRPRCFSHLSKA